MKRVRLLQHLTIFVLSIVCSGCAWWRVDPFHPLIRSDVITSLEQEKEILAKARLGATADGRVRILWVQGTPYERGYQHGALLREEVQENLGYLYTQALATFRSEELFAEAYERMRPFIPSEYIEEMHGLAHGSRLPLSVVHYIHALPSMTEWGGKKRLKEIVKAMMRGDVLSTSCSNIAVNGSAAAQGEMQVVRILDWGLHRISKLHEHPLLTVQRGDSSEIPSVNIGWVGFLGAVSGINASGITLGEMGYGDPPNETLRGEPMIFLLRQVLSQAHSLADVRRIITSATGDMSFVYLMSDGKTGESEMYLRDRDRFIVVPPNTEVRDGKEYLPPIEDTLYGGRYGEKLTSLLKEYHGQISTDLLKSQIIPGVAMPSNFQNIIYLPRKLTFWVSNAPDKSTRAAEGTYTFFDAGAAFTQFP